VQSRSTRGARAPLGIVLVVLMSVSALFLAACGGSGGSGGTTAVTSAAKGAAASNASGTLNIWTWNNEGDYVTVDKAAVARFKQKYPNVKVNITYTPFANYTTKLKAALAAGDPPDIAQVSWDSSFRQIVQSGKLAPMTRLLKRGFPDFTANAKRFVTFNGQQWAMPLDLNTLQVAYNENLFQQYGLKPPTTVAQLVGVSQALAAKGKYGIALGTKDQWAGGDAWFAQLAYTDPTRARLNAADAGKLPWTAPAFQQASDAVAALSKAKVFAPGASSMGAFNEALDLFVAQQAGMFYPVGNFISAGVDQKVNGAFKWGLFPFPSPTGGAPRATGGIARMFSLPADGKNGALAAAYLRTLTDTQGENTLVAHKFIPAWPVKVPANASPLYRDFQAAQKSPGTRTIYSANVYQALLDGMQNLLDGNGNGAALTQALAKAGQH
jgi:raffinose/stachyose/melibiose transport system substrate-binding protein